MQSVGTVPMAWKDENKSLVCTRQCRGLSLLPMSAALRAQVTVLLNSVLLVHLKTPHRPQDSITKVLGQVSEALRECLPLDVNWFSGAVQVKKSFWGWLASVALALLLGQASWGRVQSLSS